MEKSGTSGRRVAEQLERQRAQWTERLRARQERGGQRALPPAAAAMPEVAAVAPPETTSVRKLPTQRNAALEKLVHPDRFTLLVRNDTFAPSDVPAWRATLENARRHLERAIRAVGRIEDADTGEHIGTGWLVAPNFVVTNRHVGAEFAVRRDDGGGEPRVLAGTGRKRRARIDFKEESGVDEVAEFSVVRIALLTPDDNQSPDLAVFEIAETGTAGERQPPPIPLFEGAVEADQLVAAIGYPAEDADEEDRRLMRELFAGDYSVKRVSPGKVMRAGAGVVQHDCATLGGSSGSPLLDLATGGVVGVHFSGVSHVGNWAVDVASLRAVLPDAMQAGLPAQVTLDTRPLAEIEEARKGTTRPAKHFAGRNGYRSDFLPVGLPLPAPVAARQPELAMLVGKPGESELVYRNFSILHSAARRLPWVTAVNIDGGRLFRIPRAGSWARDGRIAPEQQAGDEIYQGSGYSRGHMVRRLDACWGEDRDVAAEGNKDTFVFTNACPQEQQAFNDALWGNLEDLILERTDEQDMRVSVFTGPVFADDDPFVGDLKVPMSFFKIVAWPAAGKLGAVGFVLSQAEFVESFHGTSEYGIYERPIAEIGRRAGLTFPVALTEADANRGDESVTPQRRRIRAPEDLDRHFAKG